MYKIIKTFSGKDRQKQVESYFNHNHPFGYGTEIVEENDEKIVVERWSSCD